jgi:hypothetical protein
MGEVNLEARQLILDAVNNQLTSGDPPEAREALERLTAEGYTEEDARGLIGRAMSVEILEILQSGKEYNRERYVRNLKRLPVDPA